MTLGQHDEFSAFRLNRGATGEVQEAKSVFKYAIVLNIAARGCAGPPPSWHIHDSARHRYWRGGGLAGVISLRLLGNSSKIPARPLERLYPLIWWGLWINAVTGLR